MNNAKVPDNLVLISLLSSGITSVVSIIYIILSIIGLVSRFNCNIIDVEEIGSSELFWATIFRVYIQNEDCEHKLMVPKLTQAHTVFVFMALTLTISTITLITSIVLSALINSKDTAQYINVYVYAYVGSWVGSLVVDLTFGAHLGMDHTHLTNELAAASEYIPVLDLIRQGSLYLMAISLKGFAIHAINLVLIVLMIIYLYDYQDLSKKDEHSIHKVGALNAFDQPRRHDDNWVNPEIYAGPFARGKLNSGFEEEPRSMPRNDYYNNSRGPGSFRRSDSWNHQQVAPQPVTPSMPSSSSARPFSYLEEIRRPMPVKAPVSPAIGEGWRGAWPPPPVPAPDYSPHTPRRLKPALKSNYM